MSKTFYAMYDFTVRAENAGYGFANTKKAAAFSSKFLRDSFLHSRENFDFTCKPITRKQAMKMLESVYGGSDKGLPLDPSFDGSSDRWVTLKPSAY